MELLLGGSGSSEQEEGERGGGGRGGEEEEGGQEKREGLRLAQYESPEKKIKTWSASSPSDRWVAFLAVGGCERGVAVGFLAEGFLAVDFLAVGFLPVRGERLCWEEKGCGCVRRFQDARPV